MQQQFKNLLHIALAKKASDIHFITHKDYIETSIRCVDGVYSLDDNLVSHALYHYIKYIAHLDLSYASNSQSGSFTFNYYQKRMSFRFSLVIANGKESGVLRILDNHPDLKIEDLSLDDNDIQSFKSWCKLPSGLILLSGPTGSGKTTTLHAILKEIATNQALRVVSLEDPIEILDDTYLQLQVNEQNFTYEQGLKELMRQDPDVIMIGEVRDSYSAKMLLRASLSGHLVFSTIHARNPFEVINRLHEFGLDKEDIKQVLQAVSTQRLYYSKTLNKRICLYEIANQDQINKYLNHQKIDDYVTLEDKVKKYETYQLI